MIAQRIDSLPAGGNLSQTDIIIILLIAILVVITVRILRRWRNWGHAPRLLPGSAMAMSPARDQHPNFPVARSSTKSVTQEDPRPRW